MANTSATAGALTPNIAPAPLEGTALVDFIQNWMVGITGVSGALVRPRWQPEPPNIPDEATTWIAFGITKRDADTFIYEVHNPAGQGYNETRRNEILHFLASFYGPNADSIATQFRDGIQVAQNTEVLNLNNMGLVDSGELVVAPELVKEKWLYRVDLSFSIRRQVVRDYQVQTLQSALGILNNEYYTVPIDN